MRYKKLSFIVILNGKTWDEKFVEEILSKNEQKFVHFDIAAEKSRYQNPDLADMSELNFDIKFYSTGHWRRMSRLSAIKALRLAKQGKHREALDQSFDSVKIGKNIDASQAFLITHLTANSMKKIGLMTAQTIIASSNFSPNELKEYAQELKGFHSDKQWLISVSKCNHYFMSSWIDAINEGDEEVISDIISSDSRATFDRKAENNFYFHPNRTKALFVRDIRKIIENVSNPCGEIKRMEIDEPYFYYAWNHSWIERHFTENLIGKTLHSVVMSDFYASGYSNYDGNLLLSTTRLLAALKAYKIDNGYLPDSLNELCPEYISEIPIDPFDCEPIRYSREKKIFYSIGEDQEDSGGSIGDNADDGYNWEEMPDPTFKINF